MLPRKRNYSIFTHGDFRAFLEENYSLLEVPSSSELRIFYGSYGKPSYFQTKCKTTNRDVCLTFYVRTDDSHMEILENQASVFEAVGENHSCLDKQIQVFKNDKFIITETPFIKPPNYPNNQIHVFHDQIFTPLMDFLSEIHEHKFTHGDLTDSNILLTEHSCKVIDFEHSHRHNPNSSQYEDQLEFTSSKLEDLWDIYKSIKSHWENLKNKGTAWKLGQDPKNCIDYQKMEAFLDLMDLDQAFPRGIDPVKAIEANDRFTDGLEMDGAYPTGQQMLEIMDEIYSEYAPSRKKSKRK